TTLPPTTTSTTTTSTSTTTTTTTSTTTTTTLPPLDVYDAACVVRVQPLDDLAKIVEEFDDDSVDVETVMAENGLEFDVLVSGQLLDMCVDNGLDDIDGSARTERNAVVVRREVEAQQVKLNELFAGYGIRELLVDGVSGPVTRQRLCAFRLAADLPVNRQDMMAGSEEEQILMATETLPIPFTSAILSERWALIDQTCQIMFVGVGTERLQFVFPTSSGLAQFPTRPQNRSTVFRYNSASGNGGWHNSTTYPAAVDNPLNGNMYKPLYFDRGQAIHGANNVPRSPASHGCLRLRVTHMDALVDWLGLGDVRGATGDGGRINLTVNVQGRYGG
ncbi:L,D-transpeptidase, partial [Ilumatobacter sp.]|uniref:L,D-transpeptidase n=1 Tax=Ilumatobacter sp. TaxID=1967498 RepID=UPI003AF5862C